jgi:hypothetical protein
LNKLSATVPKFDPGYRGTFGQATDWLGFPAKCGSVSLVAAAEHGGQFDFSLEVNCLSARDEMKKGHTTPSSLRALIGPRTEGRRLATLSG